MAIGTGYLKNADEGSFFLFHKLQSIEQLNEIGRK
jgi:hypothetical protein